MNSKYWRWAAMAGSVIVVKALKSGMDTGYEKFTGKQAPVNPAKGDTRFRDAFLWMVLVSVVGGLGKLLFDTAIAHKWRDDSATPGQLADEKKGDIQDLISLN